MSNPPPNPPPARLARFYPALLLILLAAILLGQYRSHHPRLSAPILAIAPPPYTATQLHFSAAQLPFPDFLAQLSRQSPVPVKTLFPANAQPAAITLPATPFPLADLPILLHRNTDPPYTAAFDPDALLLGPDDAIHDLARRVTVAYPIGDLIDSGYFSDTNLETQKQDLADSLEDLIMPDTWRDKGGQIGTLRITGNTFVIATTPDIHYQIQSLFSALRRL